MYSYSWMNRQHQQAGPASQSLIQLGYVATRDKQAADNLCQYRTANMGVQPPPSAQFAFPVNRERSNRQTAAAAHQTVSFQQPAGVKHANHHVLQNSSTNNQTGNHCLSPSNRFQVATEHSFQQNSFPNVSTRSPSKMMKANTMYSQQNLSPHWNQTVHAKPSVWRRNGSTVYDFHPTTNQRVNRESLQQASTTAQSRQTVHNQNPRQNGIQHGLSHSPPSYSSAVRQAKSSVNSLNYSRLQEMSQSSSRTNQNPTCNALQQIVSTVESMPKPCTASPDGFSPLYTSSPYRRLQYESNQTVQPVTLTVAQTYNTNTTQPLPLCSGQSIPKTTQSGMSRAQHIANAPPQQSSAADVFCVTATGNGSGKSQSFVANGHEMIEKFNQSIKQNDNSIHSSPGRTGTRAVAVVQPLSQESYQVVSKHSSPNKTIQLDECATRDESLRDPNELCTLPAVEKNRTAEHLCDGFNVDTENDNQVKSNNKFVIRPSAMSTDGAVVSYSSSAGPKAFSQEQLCADDPRPGLAINMQTDQQVATADQQSVTSDMTAELSSVPTTLWTKVMLTNFIRDHEKEFKQGSQEFQQSDIARTLLCMFWDGNCKTLSSKLKMGWYKDLITEVKEFNDKKVTEDSIILSQVKHSSKTLHKSYHVLKNGDDYSEPIYKSSWLNINEQVDDIDKGFGLSWFWRRCPNTLESGSQADQVGAGNSLPAHIVRKEANYVLSQSELESVESGEEKQASTSVSTLIQASSPNKTDGAHSSDPYYSFEIKVLPPEEAKLIFEQVQSKIPDNRDIDTQPEEVLSTSVEDEPPEVTVVTFKESKLEKESVPPIEQFCCIARWMEIGGLNTSSLNKCQCKKKQNHKTCTDKSPDKQETAAQKNGELHLTKSDAEFHSATKEENQASDGENIISHIMTVNWPEECSDLSENLTEDDNKTHLHCDKKPMNISLISINDSQSSVIVIGGSEDEDNPNSENEIPKQIPDFGIQLQAPVEECVQDQLKSARSSPSRHSDSSNREMSTSICSSDVSSEISTEVTESSVESQEDKLQTGVIPTLQIKFNHSGKYEIVKRKRKTPSDNDRSFPSLKKSKTCKPSVNLHSQGVFKEMKCTTDFVDALDSEAPATNVRTVELMLFGSALQEKSVLCGSRQSHTSSPKSSSSLQKPPVVLSVHLSPLRRIAHVPYSVKQRVFEKWRRSIPPTKIWQKSKLKAKKSAFASSSPVNLTKAVKTGPASTMELRASSEVHNKKSKHSLGLKKRRTLCNGDKIGEEKTKDAVTLKQPADQDQVMPLQVNRVLRFDVLPENFNFKYGSNGRKEATNPISDIDEKPDLDKEKDKNPSRTLTSISGTWYANHEKKHCSLRPQPVPKTCSIFQEFQKKYMEKTKPAVDNRNMSSL